jgi:hypothetical protein
MTSISETLDRALTDERVLADVTKTLAQEVEQGGMALDELGGNPPEQVPIELLSKAFVQRRFESVFGNHFIAQVAVGGIAQQGSGVVHPKYFFSTLYYSEDLSLMTVDFHDEFR